MKKRFFYSFTITMAVTAVSFSGISNNNTSVTDFTELKAKAENLCYPKLGSECVTPTSVYFDMCCEDCGQGRE